MGVERLDLVKEITAITTQAAISPYQTVVDESLLNGFGAIRR